MYSTLSTSNLSCNNDYKYIEHTHHDIILSAIISHLLKVVDNAEQSVLAILHYDV